MSQQELKDEAQSLHITIQEYAHAAAHPTIIQLFSSDGSDSGGYGGAPLKISCRDLVGNEVLTFPLGANADNAEKLRSELAKTKGVSPAALQIINHRGERLRDCPTTALQDFVAVGK